jgi:hypothetical protein
MTFKHTFIVSPLKRCSSGILGMDFLQQVGAEISLNAQALYIGPYSFPLNSPEQGTSTVRRLINAKQERSPSLGREEEGDGSVGDWEGTIELRGTVMVPRFCKHSPVSCRQT